MDSMFLFSPLPLLPFTPPSLLPSSIPPSLPPLASCVQSHVLRHHSQLAVKTPQDSLRHSHSPHVPAQPRDTQALVPTGDTAKYIKRDSSKSVLPAGLGAMVTRDDLIGKVHTFS